MLLLFKELILTFLARQVHQQQTPSIFACLRNALFLLFEDIFTGHNSGLVFYFPLHFKYFTPFSSCSHGFWGKIGYNSYLSTFISKMCFSLPFAFFQDFFSIFYILQFENDLPRYSLFICFFECVDLEGGLFSFAFILLGALWTLVLRLGVWH